MLLLHQPVLPPGQIECQLENQCYQVSIQQLLIQSKNSLLGVKGRAESKSGVPFGLKTMNHCLRSGFILGFVQSADLSALNNACSKKLNNFMFTLPDSTPTNPILSEIPNQDHTCIFAS